MSLISCFTEIYSNLALSRLRTKDPDLISLVVIPNKHSNSATYSQPESVLDKREAIVCFDITLSPHDHYKSTRGRGREDMRKQCLPLPPSAAFPST